jgi:hypothetical protein
MNSDPLFDLGPVTRVSWQGGTDAFSGMLAGMLIEYHEDFGILLCLSSESIVAGIVRRSVGG